MAETISLKALYAKIEQLGRERDLYRECLEELGTDKEEQEALGALDHSLKLLSHIKTAQPVSDEEIEKLASKNEVPLGQFESEGMEAFQAGFRAAELYHGIGK